MKWVTWNLFLAVVWTALQGSIELFDFLVGLGLGFFILLWIRKTTPTDTIKVKWLHALGLFGYFLWELCLANIQVARIVLRPNNQIRPGIIALDLDLNHRVQIFLLANLITLTPGTMSLDISGDRKTLYIYVLDLENIVQYKQKLKSGLEARVRKVIVWN